MTMPGVRQMLDKLEEIRLAVLDMSKVVARMEGFHPPTETTEMPGIYVSIDRLRCPTNYEEEK